MTSFQMDVLLGLTVLAIVVALVQLFRAFNGPAGERYLKQQTQGPFAPVTDDPSATASGPTAPPGP